MVGLIRNKITIQPKEFDKEERKKQIKAVSDFCEAIENGQRRNISFNKISPKPAHFKEESKEEDDWLLKNWGTRFNALNACWISDDEIIFDTMWNPAIPIFIKIAEHFPDIRFIFQFASKHTGRKAGEIEAEGGEITDFTWFEDYSLESYETAFELMPHLQVLYTLNMRTGTFVYDTSDFQAQIAQNGFYKDSDGCVLIGCDDKNKPLFDSADDLPF